MSTAHIPPAPPLVVSVEMGFGHLRAALPLAERLGERVVHADGEPLAAPEERVLWRRLRRAYELTSRLSQIPVAGAPLQWALDELTGIPTLYPHRDLSSPTRGVRVLERFISRGLGDGLVGELRRTGRPLLTTFFSPAILADRAGIPDVFCVVTDTDVNRIWAPLEPRRTRIRYLVPTYRAGRRLEDYGVPAERITFTGFPLPHALLGGPDLTVLKRHLARRIVRLDPGRAFRSEHGEQLARFLGPLPDDERQQPPLIAFAVGGAGAQAHLPSAFLPRMRRAVEEGRLALALVAGTKPAVKASFQEAVADAGLEGALGRGVEILFEPGLEAYFASVERLLARTDVLWTKPSELCFYAALGLPLVCGPPVGVHERFNRRWVREAGAAVKQRDPRFAADWLSDMLAEGSLAAAAWAGYVRLPKLGLYRILDAAARAG
jgi:hypothetical protein